MGKNWRNGTLVYLGVKSESELEYWGEKLTRKGIAWTVFREPDINNEITALAALTDNGVFAKLKLV